MFSKQQVIYLVFSRNDAVNQRCNFNASFQVMISRHMAYVY